MTDKITFSFGKNWQSFLSTINATKLTIAKKSLQEFIGSDSLIDKSVVDIGSGSGIFSYSAHLMDAKRIVSIDVDQFSVECTNYMHEKAQSPSNWIVVKDSILDNEVPNKYGTFDVVYSWGCFIIREICGMQLIMLQKWLRQMDCFTSLFITM